MKELSSKLCVTKKENFRKEYIRRVLCYFRRDIYEHVLSSSENDYFTLEEFRNKYKLSTIEMLSLTGQIINELEKLGWTCKTSYNDTALFVYSTKDPPPLCFPDGF